ncbi:hypothetical protein [Salinicola tamaricis]|uniref:hypothetical protein n=1 Tax=Salinicola tamaricis TaxID=1771309 RepID=UPI001F5E0CE6|nr:hypothetical protein [Salinicola tamaricis]
MLSNVRPGMRAFDEEIFGPVATWSSSTTTTRPQRWPTQPTTAFPGDSLGLGGTRHGAGRQAPHRASAHQRPDRRRRGGQPLRRHRQLGQRH